MQPGGFISAANYQLSVQAIDSVSGELAVINQQGAIDEQRSAAMLQVLKTKLGADFTQTEAHDHLTQQWVQTKSHDDTQFAMMVVQVGVLIATQGMGAAALGLQVGSVEATIANAAFSAAAADITTQVAFTGRIDWAQMGRDVGVAALTAGLDKGLGFDALAHTQTLGGDLVRGTFNAAELGQTALGIAGRGVVSAGLNSAFNGGSFEQAFTASLVRDVSALGANAVGANFPELSSGNILGHALVGCAGAALSGGDCGSGAVGAALSAVVNPLLDRFTSNDDARLRDSELTPGSMLVSGLIAKQFGLDPLTAANAAGNETLNNYLTHSQKSEMFAALSRCSDLLCKAKVQLQYDYVSERQNAAFTEGLLVGGVGEGYQAVSGLAKLAGDPIGTIKQLEVFFDTNGALEQLGVVTVQDYEQRLSRLEVDYEAGGVGSFDAGVETGRLLFDGLALAGGVGDAGSLAERLGLRVVEREGLDGGTGAASTALLNYDISEWGNYGLPSDGYFVRTLTSRQYRYFRDGIDFAFGGKPVDGYPGGMGFLGSAEEVSGINTVREYKEALMLDYKPKYLLEFQLKDPAGLQNVLETPYEQFIRGGRSGAGFSEFNYPGINTNNIVNSRARILQ